ncbi:MAG TPA: hypothetical protein VG537_03865 [Candidatus Kapabacteria bacterium]|jgi:hypothetical protein|nr:hypothetical protein [Candidatus Kapabacteria bacterium]
MRTSWKATIFALSLGLASFATLPAAQAKTPGDRDANAYHPGQFDNRDANNYRSGQFENRGQFDARVRDIDRQRADLSAREQSLRAELQNMNYYHGRGDFADRDRIVSQIRDINQRENMLSIQRNDLMARQADFQRHDDHRDRDRDGR